MEDPRETNDEELREDEAMAQMPDEADEDVLVGEETHGNRVQEKIGNRGTKKQETQEEAKKSITGTEAHHDPRNEHSDSGPAPLKRY
jgi:hypothetical protein